MNEEDKVLTVAGAPMRRAFLGWQCRLRQLAMRDHDGRPSAGMRPTLHVAGQKVGPITVVMTRREDDDCTAEFRHIAKRTHDPKERRDAALRYFQANYFQEPERFDDRLTAVFGPDASLPRQIEGRVDCRLVFDQFSQIYELICSADLLNVDEPQFQATFWHNSLFNAALPAGVQILRFSPDWSRSRAEPAPR